MDLHGLLILGSVVLAVTGGEALYADMGHFGVRPIRLTWTFFVLPALVSGLPGAGGADPPPSGGGREPLLRHGAAGLATYLLVLLSSAATVIASQALISGAFSLTRQAMLLGYLPRVTIKHTAYHTEGQIYIPEVNNLLAVGCLALVLDVPRVGEIGRGLRHRRHRNDGDHVDPLLHRGAPLMGLEQMESGGSARAFPELRYSVPGGQSLQVLRGRLRADADRCGPDRRAC